MVDLSRRRFVAGGTAALATGVAGCAGGGTGDPSAAQQRVIDYLNADPPAENFDGSFAYLTGMEGGPEEADAVVDVGAEGNGGNLAFDAPAIKITAGTVVRWEWTGEGGAHNVVSHPDSDFDFDSGDPQTSGTYKRTFDTPGVGLYFCDPHQDQGMKGGFVVAE
jgi:serine/threonine-protein kinase